MATVVLIHGIGSSAESWQPHMRALSSRCRTVAVDLPGHGETPGPFSFDAAVDAVEARVGLRAVLVGVGAGAAVAVQTCLRRPGEVAGLILASPAVEPIPGLGARRALARTLPARLLVPAMARVRTRRAPQARDAVVKDLHRCGRRSLAAAWGELSTLDLTGKLNDIACPTLVVCGAQDRGRLGIARRLASGIGPAVWQTVPGAGHHWYLEQPDALTRHIAEFVISTTV